MQQVAGVPDPLPGGDALGQPGPEAGADHDVAGPPDEPVAAGRRLGDHVDRPDPAVGLDRPDLDGPPPVADRVGELGGAPLEVVVELDPGRVEGLQVDEVREPAVLLEVRQEGEAAARVAHGDQVLEEGHLHGGPLQQHAAVPAEAFLLFHEADLQGLVRGPPVVLVDRYGQGQVGGAEAYADQVVGTVAPVRCAVLARSRHARPSVDCLLVGPRGAAAGRPVPGPGPSLAR